MKHSYHNTSDETPNKLLIAAVELFGKHGFEAVSVSDLLGHANISNRSAINYYFGGKQELYARAFEYACSVSEGDFPFPDESESSHSSREKLYEFVHVMLQRFLTPVKEEAAMLMARELASPSKALDKWVSHLVEPIRNKLDDLLIQLMPGKTYEERHLVGFSIMGQCLFYRHDRAVIERLAGSKWLKTLTAKKLARHSTDFSLAGMRP